MKNDLKIKFNPTDNDLQKVKEWLETDRSGFIRNWRMIKDAYKEKKIISLQLNKEAIGFFIWTKNEIYAEIDIFAIQLKHREKGFGKFLLENTIDYLKQQDMVLIKLFCKPSESEKFWRTMGFIKFPHKVEEECDLTFYKPLIEVEETINKPDMLNKLELWDLKPYQIKDKKPKWCWNITNSKLLDPIIQPCKYDWNLRWTKDGKIIKDKEVQYFSQNNQIKFGSFIFIKKLEE